MKKFFSIFIIMLFISNSFAITLSDDDKTHLWSWYSFWMSKGKTHQEVHELLDKDAKYELTEEMLQALIKEAKEINMVAQDVEANKMLFATAAGRNNPEYAIKLHKENIAWIEKYSPKRKDILSSSYESLAIFYGKLGDFKKTVQFLDKAIEYVDDIEYRLSRAAARFKVGDIKGSDEDFAVLEKRCPDNPRYLKYKVHFAELKKEQQVEKDKNTSEKTSNKQKKQ